jgi:hypothetical protein
MIKVEIPEDLRTDAYQRLPRPGQKLRGLHRSTFLDLSAQGLIRIVKIKKPGARRGINLIDMRSLDAYMNSLP